MSPDYLHSLNKLIDKATSASLLEDNLSYILDVCDKVNSDPEVGSGAAIDTIKNKLNSNDGNVQLRTLSLLTSIAENCGSRVRQLIATKSFTSILISKLSLSSIHKEIKVKIVQVMQQLTDSFKSDPSLKPMELALKDAKLTYPVYFAAPSKPTKQQYSGYDEEQLLQQALKASEEEYQQQLKRTAAVVSPPPAPESRIPEQTQTIQQSAPTAPRTFSRVRALYDSTSNDPEDLQFQKGDVITILDKEYSDWCKGSLRGVTGLFPFNYVTPLYDPTPAELIEEAKRETDVLSKSRDIETLLSILTQAASNPDSESSMKYQALDDERFKKLYQSVVGIKPELAVLIDKYAQRQSDLTDLHQRLKEAGNIYEELNDHSRYQRQPQQQYYTPQYTNHQQPAQYILPQQQTTQQPTNTSNQPYNSDSNPLSPRLQQQQASFSQAGYTGYQTPQITASQFQQQQHYQQQQTSGGSNTTPVTTGLPPYPQ